jgi:NTE family protein
VEGLLYVLTLILRHQVMGVLPLLRPDHTVVYLPAPCPLPVAPHDFSRSAQLIDVGHGQARAFLARLRLERAGVYGHPHYH